jgi:eukaryotic-like serine/threonine-protein kinase
MVASVAVVVTEGARRSEAVARLEAETNFDMAQEAVEDYLTNVSENRLLKEQDAIDIGSLRQDLLKSALPYYQRFAAQRRDDPRLQKQLARAYFRIGQITKEIGSHQQAIEAFRSAQSIWEPLVKSDPKQHDLEGYLAECGLAIGRLQIAASNFEQALNSLTHARAMLERLAVEYPLVPSYRSTLADCYSELAIIDGMQESGQGLALLEKAKEIRQRLIDQYPANLDYQKSLAMTINVVGWAHFKQHDDNAALESFQEVQDNCLRILKNVTVGPKPIWLLDLLALSQYNMASIHKKNGELVKALELFEQSLGYRSTLVDSHPSVSQFQVKLGRNYREIAQVQHKAHEDAKAFQSTRLSVDVFDSLVRSHPEQASYHSELGLSWNGVGILYDEARKNAEAIRPFKQAVIEQERAVDKSKDVDLYKEYLYNHLDNLGEQYVDLGRVADGLQHYRRALLLRRQLSAANPKNREYALEVAKSLCALGNLRRHLGEPIDAGQSFSEARRLLERWLVAAPADPVLQGLVAAALHNEASALADQAKWYDARPLLNRAVELIRPLANRAVPSAEAVPEREALSEALWDFARVLRALMLPAEANRADAERKGLWKDRPTGELVALARDHASRANLIGYGKAQLSVRGKAVRELDLDQAANELSMAISSGFKDLKMLKADPDLTILLSHDDLNSSIKRLESSDQILGPPPLK